MPARPAPRPLDEQICFTLYRANMTVNRGYKPMLDAMGITYPQYLVLNALGEEDARPVGVIANRLGLEPSTVTPLVKRMEEAGLVRRQRNRDNERQVQVHLTPEGSALLERSRCLGEALVDRSGLGAEGLDRLNRDLQALLARLEKALLQPDR